MTRTKTNVLNGVQWVEAPIQPKTQSKTQLYLRRSTPVTIVTEIQLITNPTKEQVNDVLIVLCRVMQNTMSSFYVHAIYGNIALVEFEPVTGIDPLLPLPLLEMGGYFNFLNFFNYRPFDKAYRKLATHVMRYNNTTWGNHWYATGRGLVNYLCGYVDSDKRFTTQEKLYFRNQINQTLAMPTRRGK